VLVGSCQIIAATCHDAKLAAKKSVLGQYINATISSPGKGI